MTDKNYTHLVCVDDASGSMNEFSDPPRTKAQDVEAGTKSLIAAQAALPGRLTVSLATFDWVRPHYRPGAQLTGTRINWVARMASAHDPCFAAWHLEPYGGTPLLDVLGSVITDTGRDLAALPEHERPGHVIFVIGTDGEENKSSEYSRQAIADMITTQRESYQWEFAFIGADFDAFAEAGGMGISRGSTVSVGASAFGAAYMHTNSAVTRSRGPGGQSLSYSDAEREDLARKSGQEKSQGKTEKKK